MWKNFLVQKGEKSLLDNLKLLSYHNYKMQGRREDGRGPGQIQEAGPII